MCYTCSQATLNWPHFLIQCNSYNNEAIIIIAIIIKFVNQIALNYTTPLKLNFINIPWFFLNMLVQNPSLNKSSLIQEDLCEVNLKDSIGLNNFPSRAYLPRI